MHPKSVKGGSVGPGARSRVKPPEPGEGLRIGALAQATGLTPDTLRYYERVGLLQAARRTGNGYRLYGAADVERVRFIRAAQALGFTLAEVHEAVGLLGQGALRRADIEARLQRKVAEIDEQMARLRAQRRELLATASRLSCDDGAQLRPALPARRAPSPTGGRR